MSITNYSELQTTVADFLNRSDLTSQIKTFIQICEADLNRLLRHWRLENRATAEVDGRYSAIPVDFIEPIRLHLETDEKPLELVGSLEMQKLRSANTATGKPKHYCITQGEIELFPTPDTTYNLEMYYYAKIPALSDSNTTNNILTYFPDVYLYGALIHSAPFLHEDARLQTWSALFQSALDGINQDNERAKTGSAGRRMKIRSY